MNNDAELLRAHLEHRSENAFAELVQRHIGLVYATALRQLAHDAHLAEDVAQSVFTDVARKAAALRDRTSLAGWLYLSTQKAAAAVVRREQRRKRRELVAQSMHLIDSAEDSNPDYARLRPLLEDAIVELGSEEREAVVLRFFGQRSFAEIGAALVVSEEAARKRVDRALDKLHAALARRGITSTAVALGAALATTSAAAVPAGLSAKIAGVALAEAGAASATAFSLAGLGAKLLPPAAIVTAGALALLPLHRAQQARAAEIARLSEANAALPALRAENAQLARAIADARDLERDAAGLPQARATLASLPPPPPPITSSGAVTITPRSTIDWEGESITLNDFVKKIGALQAAATNGESKLVIHARGARYDAMLYALDEARKSGIKHIVVDADAMPDLSGRVVWF